jgi:hypothetical protein
MQNDKTRRAGTHPTGICRPLAFTRANNQRFKLMKNLKSIGLAALCGAALFIATTSNSADSKAADVKTYQVTGPVLEATPTSITVQKGDEKWEIARNRNTKITGEVKVGAKVTIYYRMVAEEVEVKDAKPKK